jgi:hypothetical protein
LVYRKKWIGYDVFRASDKDDAGKCIGYPTFILVDGKNNALFSSSDEALDIMA